MTQPTLQNIPSATKRAIVLAIVQVIVAITAFLGNTFESGAMLMLLALGGVAALVVTGVLWNTSQTARRALQVVFCLPMVISLVGVVCAAVTELCDLSVTHMLNLSMSGEDTPFWYTLLFDLAVTVTYAQTLMLFLFPAMIAAATFGEQKERRSLRIAAFSHLAVMAVNIVVFARQFHIPSWNDMSEHVPTYLWGETEVTLVQLVMLAVTAVFTLFACLVGTDKKKAPNDVGA